MRSGLVADHFSLIRHVAVSFDLQEPAARASFSPSTVERAEDGIESARMALDEFHGTHDEFTAFFGDVFDQLQGLSLELFARHRCLEASAEQKSEADETLGIREEFQRSVEQLQLLHGQLQAGQQETQQGWVEIRAGYQRFVDDQADLREIRDNFRQLTGEFSGIKEDVQRERKALQDLCANVESQLTRLSSLTAELAETQARPAHNSQIDDIFEHARQQRADWIEQRAALEAELDALRHRAAEQAEALNEQKRLAGQQQAELAGELKRMRSLLEALASQFRRESQVPGQKTKLPSVDHAVLGSVLAEFEMLQSDIAFR
jgi:DNA repair exonuclease SbcCD ATPase subunit